VSELRVLRERQQGDSDALDRDGGDVFGSAALVVRTGMTTTYPTTSNVYYTCSSYQITGTEVEGGAGSLTADSGLLMALNLGTAIPPIGTAVVAHSVGGRWVFRYDGP
jgi:hypothetical protein